MANIKSAKKRAKTNEIRRQRNRKVKDNLKKNIKNFYKAVESGDREEAKAAYNQTSKRLDQAAAKHVIHKNKASRKKSQLSKAFREIWRWKYRKILCRK